MSSINCFNIVIFIFHCFKISFNFFLFAANWFKLISNSLNSIGYIYIIISLYINRLKLHFFKFQTPNFTLSSSSSHYYLSIQSPTLPSTLSPPFYHSNLPLAPQFRHPPRYRAVSRGEEQDWSPGDPFRYPHRGHHQHGWHCPVRSRGCHFHYPSQGNGPVHRTNYCHQVIRMRHTLITHLFLYISGGYKACTCLYFSTPHSTLCIY